MAEDEIDLSMFGDVGSGAEGSAKDEVDLSMFGEESEALPTGDAKKKSRRFSLPTGECGFSIGRFYFRFGISRKEEGLR
jgi:hypothetical protein